MIGELADHARKQLKIEMSLNKIKEMWESDPATNLEILKERSRADNEEYYKITSTENIFVVIEEHTQDLSQHKSSPYYKQFDEKIDLWDNNIAAITETLEMLIQVQSKWQYLESIFKGQPDLAKQLPGESATFTKIDQQFKAEMVRVAKERNCYRALIGKGQDFLKFLSDQNYKLEGIQKQLQQFL
jgi:dynein heavy chain